MEGRPKIEIVRVSSMEQTYFPPLDSDQLRAAYSHLKIGVFCMEPEEKTVCENKPPIEQTHKYKKNLGPVSRLLRRRQHQTTCLKTKSCDNIYNVNRNSTTSDWKINKTAESDLQGRHSNSLDWRVAKTVNSSSDKLNWTEGSRSTEHLSKSAPLTSNLSASSAKSKIVSLLKRLSPRLSRSKVSLPPSPTICPWVQVEYANESINMPKSDESQETDISFQRELQINELKKKKIGVSPTKPYPVPTKKSIKAQILVNPTNEVQALEKNRASNNFRT